MSEKATATATPEKTSHRGHGTRQNGASSRLGMENSYFGLQQTIGNQAMLHLLEAGVIQAKLRVSQPGDADEIEADRVAERVVSAQKTATIHRKCACDGGTPCSKCAGEEDETIHRSVALPQIRSSGPSIQRAPAEQSASPAGEAEKTPHRPHAVHPLVVEDDAKDIQPHQMRKSQFIALLRTDACATADAVLMSVGRTTKGCPYIEKWLSFYEKQSSQHLETAMQKYAPETATARSAHEAIRLLLVRIQKAALSWAKTGKVEGLPPEIASQISSGGGLLGKLHDFATTGAAGAIFGFIGGKGKKEETSSGGVMRKARSAEPAPAHDAASVKSQLGTGHSLDSRVQSQMSSAFGYDFSGVRVHTDSSAAKLSSNLQARAFTIGNDVAFASNEYRPGTLIGDALIAHELAHVVQQSGASAPEGPQRKSEREDNALEQDADRAAVGAVVSAWTNGRRGIRSFASSIVPTVRSGLRLSRCKDEKTSKPACPKETITMSGEQCGRRYGAIATYCYEGAANWWFKEHVEDAPGPHCQGGGIKQTTEPFQSSDPCVIDKIFDSNGPPSRVAPCTDKTLQTVFIGPTKETVEQCKYDHEQNVEVTTAPDAKSGTVKTTTGGVPTQCGWHS